MSESERAALDAEGALELTKPQGPGDPAKPVSRTVKDSRSLSLSSERQIKVERAQKCLENAALVSKRIKEHQRATAELLGKTYEEDSSESSTDVAPSGSRPHSAAAADVIAPISVEDALNIPGISESLANTLKQKELLMERIKQYKDISKRPAATKPSKKSASSLLIAAAEEQDVKQAKLTKSDPSQLLSLVKEKEKTISIMQVKIKAMEATVLDLREKLGEKDSVIDAKTRATTLIADSLSKKQVDSVNLLEDTRQQMIKMQENFVAMETEWKSERGSLLNEIKIANEKITILEDANTVLTNEKVKMCFENSKLTEKIEQNNRVISELEHKLHNVSKEYVKDIDAEDEKGSKEIASMEEMTKRLEFLEHLNCQIKQSNLELESKLASLSPQKIAEQSSKKLSPQVSRKRGKSATRSTSIKQKSPWSSLAESSSQESAKKSHTKEESSKEDDPKEIIIQSLNKELLDKEYLIAEKDKCIKNQEETIAQQEKEIYRLNIKPDRVDVGLTCEIELSIYEQDTVPSESDADLTPEQLSIELSKSRQHISSLNAELEAANKNMLKVKSAHKLKLKQLQKTIDSFMKMSDANSEVMRLNEEVNILTQKVAELEEDKGNLQLHLVDYDSGRLTGSDLDRKLAELQALSGARLKAISDLEMQKFELVQELHTLKQINIEMEDKLVELQHECIEHVSAEMKCVQLEEQLDTIANVNKELQLVIDNLKLDKEHSKKSLKELQDVNAELSQKLDVYMQENIELTDKLEKLSAEKVSSAESIEIVESLTPQEKLELEEYIKKMKDTQDQSKSSEEGHTEIAKDRNEFNESFAKLSGESAELNKKIEMFTQERCEVMEKMNELKIEKDSLLKQIEEMMKQKNESEKLVDSIMHEKEHIISLNVELSAQIEGLKAEQLEIVRENAQLVKRSLSAETSPECETPKENLEPVQGDNGGHDEKPHAPKVKPAKQLTKEILKLKNTIKEREAEIADCQMKILSLEEQHQKMSDIIKNNSSSENALKDENKFLKEQVSALKTQIGQNTSVDAEIQALKQSNENLQSLVNSTQIEYSSLIANRDARINELENLLVEYERNIAMYNESLQSKDKDITDYLNQITQLNSISQKLKSTIELLEEKLKDNNEDLVKSLNIQIVNLQNLIKEQETKILNLEEESVQFKSINSNLSERNAALEAEIQKLYNSLLENESKMKEIQELRERHDDEVALISNQCKEKDEEIHEIKLQLRKESIENENLRKSNIEFDTSNSQCTTRLNELKLEYENLKANNEELTKNYSLLETKNKELMEKLKKFAVNLKKKSNMCAELEQQVTSLQSEIDKNSKLIFNLEGQISSNQQRDNASKSLELQENNRIRELEIQLLTLLQEKSSMAEQLKDIENTYIGTKQEMESHLTCNVNLKQQIYQQHQEMIKLKSTVEVLNQKLSEALEGTRDNANLNAQLLMMESQIIQKEKQIEKLLGDNEKNQEELKSLQFGYEAKITERDMFIENLESEISTYRARIARLEESVSIMEERRHSLERKADQLDYQLDEKQKAYTQYHSQEDELVNRMAVLIDHDQVVEKQLKEIENENMELRNKLQNLLDENNCLQVNYLSAQKEYAILEESAHKKYAEAEYNANFEIAKLTSQIKDLLDEKQAITDKYNEEFHNMEAEFQVIIEKNLKEKKLITEKYDRAKEKIEFLESDLKQFGENVKLLTVNPEEGQKIHMFSQHALSAVPFNTPSSVDYTEQYVAEMNNLHATLSKLNLETEELRSQNLEYINTISRLENNLQHSKSSDMVSKLHEAPGLQTVTDEALPIPPCHQTELFDVSLLESQIETNEQVARKQRETLKYSEETTRKVKDPETPGHEIFEDAVVSKKAYLCYYEPSVSPLEEKVRVPEIESDPFNSDDGWGALEGDTHDYSSASVANLLKENKQLKTDIANANTKLAKAMKKLKELKMNNERLANELKTANTLSQMNVLNTAIEDELKTRVDSLEKDLQSVSGDLSKEKREKEALAKQNIIFKDANDRFVEMKEKLENELVLWKLKFKELTDKVSLFEWGEDHISTQSHEPSTLKSTDNHSKLIEQLEKENEELNSILDELRKENTKLMSIRSEQSEEIANLSNEITNLKSELGERQKEMATNSSKYESTIKNKEIYEQVSLDKDRMIQEYQHQVRVLHDEISAQKLTIDQMNTKLYEMTSECNDIREKGAVLRAELRESFNNAGLQNTMDDLHHKLDVLTNENEALKATVNNLTVIINNITTECNVLREENNSLSNQLQESATRSDERKAELEQELQILLNENSAQKSVINELTQNVNGITSEYNILKASNNAFIQQINELKSSCENVGLESSHGEESGKNNVEKIKSLEKDIQNLNADLKYAHTEITNLKAELISSQDKIKSLDTKYVETESKCLQLNSENDQLLATVTELRTSISSAVDQRGYEVAEMWKQHLAQRESEFATTERELREQVNTLESKYEQLLINVQSASQEETEKMIAEEQLSSLQSKLKDKEEHLLNLQNQHSHLVSEIELLRSEMEDERVMHESKLLNQQIESEKHIAELQRNLTIQFKEKDAFISNLNAELETAKEANEKMSLNSVELTNNLLHKDNEISHKTQEYNILLTQKNEEFDRIRHQLLDYERKTEELGFQKESEMAELRLKMQEDAANFENHNSKLRTENAELLDEIRQKVKECTLLNHQVTDSNRTFQEYSENMNKMKSALESQETEIVTLKEEVEHLQDLLENSKISKHVTFASDTKPPAEEGEAAEPAELVPKAELNLALYMLYQRDLRIEEVTMELTSLLEERDTLQLRLSDSLRGNEELRARCAALGIESPPEAKNIAGRSSPGPSGSQASSSETETLRNKLGELRGVRQARDVRLRQDSEQRQLEMASLQRDVSRLPPEAAEHLRQAHYTLSRDSQGTSTTLINWLRGKTTPKVVHM